MNPGALRALTLERQSSGDGVTKAAVVKHNHQAGERKQNAPVDKTACFLTCQPRRRELTPVCCPLISTHIHVRALAYTHTHTHTNKILKCDLFILKKSRLIVGENGE